MNSEQWEARCRRCGRCCYEKIDFEGEIYYTDEPCEYLDLKTRLCTIYDRRRHQIRSGCASLTPEVLKMGALPADCPYVEGIENYPAPHPFEEEE
ncbi:MAG TPA: hypothetical protein VJ955_01860 [Desulfuromonadales bacterium]|nr:hypothetical protein [Desulfuromonadales bacterium]